MKKIKSLISQIILTIQNKKNKDILAIILSALTSPDDIKREYESGAEDYVLKSWSNQDPV